MKAINAQHFRVAASELINRRTADSAQTDDNDIPSPLILLHVLPFQLRVSQRLRLRRIVCAGGRMHKSEPVFVFVHAWENEACRFSNKLAWSRVVAKAESFK